MSNPPKRPRSPAVAIDPCLEGQYANIHAADQPTDENRGGQQAKKRCAANSQAMTAVNPDYTDTLLSMLRENSAGATPQPDMAAALPGASVDSAARGLLVGPDRLTESGDFAQAHNPQLHAPYAGTSSSTNAAASSANAAAPSTAGPSGASSSTRASPANLPSLPDTFPEPPVPVQAEDGSLPARSDFAEGLDAYVQSLHPIKRNKALMPHELYSLIINILRKPQDTTVGDPQLRFWVRQRFQLMNGPGDRCCALHEGKRVVLRDEIYDVIARAHTESQHGGRDKTYNVLKRDWSYVPKETVATFIKLCSVCNGKRTKEKKQAADRKEKKSRATSVCASPTSSQLPAGSAPPATPSTSELYGLPVNLSNALGQAPVHFASPPNPSSSAAAAGYYSILDPLGGSDSSSMALPVPPELAVAYGAPPAAAAGQFDSTGGSTFTTAAVAAAAAAIEASRQPQQQSGRDSLTSRRQQ